MTATTIDNMQDIIDSRDIIERIAELKSLADDLDSAIDAKKDAIADVHAADDADKDFMIEAADDAIAALKIAEDDFGPEESDELTTLTTLEQDAKGYAPDWSYGESLIRDSHFKEYAQELAEDCGMLENSTEWPGRCIDWDQAARELQMDYTAVDFDGVTYWIR